MNKVSLYRFIIIFTIMALTNVFGLIANEDLIFGGLPLQDVPIIIFFVYCILNFRKIVYRFNHLNSIIVTYVLLTTIVILSMPFREEESLIGAFQVGRVFYVLLLTFVIEDEIYYSGSSSFIRNTIYLTGTYFATVSLLSTLNPTFVAQVFKGLDTFTEVKLSATKSGIYSNGTVFVHLAFVIKTLELFYKKQRRRIIDYTLVFFFFIGMFFMGFRAVMFALIFSLLLVSFFMLRKWVFTGVISQARIAGYIIGGLLLVFIADFTSGNRISNFAESVINDVSGKTALKKNTFEYREQRALKYQIPTIMNNHPWIGMGFIYKTGKAADKYHMDSAGTYRVRALYNVDFGYGTMWARFGIIGSAILLFVILRAFWSSIKNAREFASDEILQLSIVILGFLITNYTWAVLDMPQGLIVLAFSIGLASEYYYEYNKEPERLLQLD